jgi:hypothetical protein
MDGVAYGAFIPSANNLESLLTYILKTVDTSRRGDTMRTVNSNEQLKEEEYG